MTHTKYFTAIQSSRLQKDGNYRLFFEILLELIQRGIKIRIVLEYDPYLSNPVWLEINSI
jgi:hypothetical protein